MPSPTLVRNYLPESSYHVYNRGNNKQRIFFDEKDYWIFRRYLRSTLQHFSGKIEVHVFALLENHFHLLIFQEHPDDITRFMRTFIARYRKYIKEKYQIAGALFGSKFHAVLLKTSSQQASVRRYILHNPVEAGLTNCKHVGTKP